MHLILTYVIIPLIHWAIVTAVIIGIGKLAEKLAKAGALAAQSRDRAMALPVNARMAEVSLQVIRADGTKEKPQTHRTYRNPFMRWAWAIKQAFTT
jgi:hypothetical protein